MTVARGLDLQEAVFDIVTAAVSGLGALQVFDHAPTNPPLEFIRIDGFSIYDESWKNAEVGRHSFQVNHFLRPVEAASHPRGQSRGKQVIAAIHAALMAAEILGSTVSFEFQDVAQDIDGATMHVFNRYTIRLS